jgi:hypothetical protein
MAWYHGLAMTKPQGSEGIHFGWIRKIQSVLDWEFQPIVPRYLPLGLGMVLEH